MMANEAASVLVVAAHPDDEALGCGGTLARHARDGATVHIMFMTDGVGARGADKGAAQRRDAAQKAASVLGAGEPVFLDFPDNQMDTVPLLDVVKQVESVIGRFRPSTIYTHHGGDLNVDHAITQRAVMTACRPLPDFAVRAIYGFEVLSSTEWSTFSESQPFVPTRYVNVADFLEKKLKALECYESEMRAFPHARSYEAVRALATLRGASVGLRAAEAFSVLRSIEA